jgi:hypothetical protein
MTISCSSRSSRAAAFVCVLAFCASSSPIPVQAAAGAAQQLEQATALPDRLSDEEFWTLVSEMSEPGGYFQITDNFTSNEREVGRIFSGLRERGVRGGVYLGVGPEQNFTYIAAIRPAMAFIVDIRRQAVMQHLMYKAVFELAEDRADFISLLFSLPRPEGLGETTPIQQIWATYDPVATDHAAAARNATRIVEHLTKTHRFAFTAAEIEQLDRVLRAFVRYGPDISTRGAPGNGLAFSDLTSWSLDSTGQPQSFLSTEEHFRYVKTLQERNLVVPVSGDFGGPKAIRAIAAYLQKQRATVSAFYVSNVEQYLFQDNKHVAFYANVATLPFDHASVFIRPYSLRRSRNITQPLCAISAFLDAVNEGRVLTNNDALACGT